MSLKHHSKQPAKKEERLVDLLFVQYDSQYQHPTNRLIQWICIPLITFGITGLIWFLPFPYLSFLGQYNGFINWFTLAMAIVVYYYLKLAPTLSYAMLLTFGLFSFLIVQLEYWEKAGGLAPWIPCLSLFIIGCMGQFIGSKIEGRQRSLLSYFKLLLIGPIWLWHIVFKKLKIPY